MSTTFRFKKFAIKHGRSAMKVNTDGILLGAWVDIGNAKVVLDVGTGSGLVAMMIAQRYQDVSVTGVEPHSGSCEDARDNFISSSFCERMNLIEGTVQDLSVSGGGVFDHIVSNPPFFTSGLLHKNQEVANARHTLSLSQSDLITSALRLLKPIGKLSLILPEPEGKALLQIASRNDLFAERITHVFGKVGRSVERILMTLSPKESEVDISALTIYDANGQYTEEYKELTKAFYLNH